MISIIGWNYVTVPLIVIVILCIGVLLSGMLAKKELVGMRKQLLIMGAFILIGAISIFGALYIAFNTPASRIVDGVQGRYFVPFIVPFIMLLAAYLPFEVKIKDKIAPLLFGSLSTLGLLVSVLYYILVTY
jgi:uncharacterized membrane protein